MLVFIHRHEKLILLALGIIFFAITAPGISWGTPNIWHPDEQVKVADRALHGLTIIDTRNFNYPSLPKYTMYWLGRVVYGRGYTRADFIQSARLISVLLGSLIVVVTYVIARKSGARVPGAVFAACLVISSSEMALNARFAHVDIYLVFFSCLSVLLLLKYQSSRKLPWLYGSFLTVGLAASSKYNGLSLIVAVILVYIITEKNRIAENKLHFIMSFFIGLVLTFIGFVIGTPRMLLSMLFYVPRVVDALFHHATYNIEAGDQIGLFGQWQVLISAHGVAGFIFFVVAAIWVIGTVGWSLISRIRDDGGNAVQMGVVLLSILALNLPILVL
jgi:4-amino-4-deoxy-L-arabinose transferase-like glycosyltransferase